MLIKKIQTVITHHNQLEAQRSGFELERRSKGAERSFKAAPKRDRLETEWSGFRSDVCVDVTNDTNSLCCTKSLHGIYTNTYIPFGIYTFYTK